MSKIILTEKQYQKLLNKIEEEVDLTNYEAPFSSEDFVNWVNSEFDTEILNMAKSKIEERINFINTMIGIGTRTEIKGFRR
tara:strand:- start:270 stop:512 length:243 start_codon:yes stop_codon:yes gene_type:complete